MKILSLKKEMDKFRVTSWISSKVNFELLRRTEAATKSVL